ncbi:cupin [Roseateles violae]|uniref:Cupin n=1 Tax=Roseateles violae TaxID=3058042 RepID=A0ABT8DZ18_9BURK|nr:cupin [Pelomonas sp. PFR6]MDN3922804.1 cupin [Pelomonas sp. PFR6]
MAIPHANHGQLIDLKPLSESGGEGQSTSLIKTDQLQLLHIVLRQGQQLHEHKVAGELSIQCLAGRVRLDLPGRQIPLSAGQLTLLHGGEPHALVAELDSSLLLTLALQH